MLRKKPRDYRQGPPPTPREQAALLWGVVRPLLVRVLWIAGLVLVMMVVTAISECACGH